MERYTTLDLWYFDDPPIAAGERQQIRQLTKAYSSKLWGDYIAPQRHLMLVDQTHWTSRLTLAEYSWLADWEQDDVAGFVEFLQTQVFLYPDEIVLFFWCKETGIETTWEMFLKHWISFLYEDEAPILFCPNTGFTIVFGPHGSVRIGGKQIQPLCIHCEFNQGRWDSCAQYPQKPQPLQQCINRQIV